MPEEWLKGSGRDFDKELEDELKGIDRGSDKIPAGSEVEEIIFYLSDSVNFPAYGILNAGTAKEKGCAIWRFMNWLGNYKPEPLPLKLQQGTRRALCPIQNFKANQAGVDVTIGR